MTYFDALATIINRSKSIKNLTGFFYQSRLNFLTDGGEAAKLG